MFPRYPLYIPNQWSGATCSAKGCDGVEGSAKTNDVCGVCAGDGSTCKGCDGVSHSGKVSCVPCCVHMECTLKYDREREYRQCY